MYILISYMIDYYYIRCGVRPRAGPRRARLRGISRSAKVNFQTKNL